MKKIKKIEVWECQDCGALYESKRACWCCIDMDGEYAGKRKNGYEIIKVGEFTKKQLESITQPLNIADNKACPLYIDYRKSCKALQERKAELAGKEHPEDKELEPYDEA